jgi:type I restriction enzyme S subunit
MNRADQVYALGRGVAAVRGKAGKGHTRFIRHAIHYRLAKLLAGSERSTFPNIGKDEIKAFEIYAPADPSEQEQFAVGLDARLSRVKRLHIETEKQSEAIRALPSATLREFFNFGNATHA